MEDLEALLRGAADRFRHVRLTARHRYDRSGQYKMAAKFPANPAAAFLLRDPNRAPDQVGEHIWKVWMSRPHRYRVEQYRPPSTLSAVSAADEVRSWFYFPDDRSGSIRPRDLYDIRTNERVFAEFTRWLHPEVSELLDPSFLWDVGEGVMDTPRLEPIGSRNHHGRPAILVRLTVGDWDTREEFGETLWMADDYELLVDEATGIILRAASRIEGEEYRVGEIEEIAFDEPIDEALLEPPAIERWL